MGEPPVITETQWWEKIRGWLFVGSMLISALFGCFYVLAPGIFFLLINPHFYRVFTQRMAGFWLALPAVSLQLRARAYLRIFLIIVYSLEGLMQYLFGIKLNVRGAVIDRTKPALIIMNHRTRLDWLFFWCACIRIDPWLLTTEKISLKGILKHLPGVGAFRVYECCL